MESIAPIKLDHSATYPPKKIALLPGNGLGDCLFFLPIAWALMQSGYHVHLFAPPLKGLQLQAPLLNPLLELCNPLELEAIGSLSDCVQIFIQSESSSLHLLKSIRDLKIVGARKWKGKTQAEQIEADIRESIPFDKIDFSLFRRELLEALALQAPKNRSDFSQVAIHPSSSHSDKNWPLAKYKQIASSLKARGYEPFFCLSSDENALADQLKADFNLWQGQSLTTLSQNLLNCRLLIGNDSGIGHLASLLGIPTLSLFHSRTHSQLWRPAWSKNRVVLPLIPLPGISRRALWKSFLLPAQVLYQALSLIR